jgi:iron complex outermembrane receptor protein
MVLSKHSLVCAAFLGTLPSYVSAEDGLDFDTAVSGLEEISVTAARTEKRALQPSKVLDKLHFDRTSPTEFTEIFRAVMGVGIRTNSRGEAVLRLRGSEERQSQIFIDGAPISIPWDGRTDLSLFPASLVRSVNIIKSAAPLEYGANAVLGVVDISTQKTGEEIEMSTRSEIGSHNGYLIEGEVFAPLGNSLSVQLGANYRSRDAISVPGGAPIPFDPQESKGRTNTDLKSTSLFAAVTLSQDWGNLRLSAMDISAEKGIAAAAHIDPADGGVRFWRYPDWDMTQISLAGDIDINDTTNLRVNTWHQSFGQSIVSYDSINYAFAEAQQDDTDNSYGGRIVLARDGEIISTRLVASMQQSTHTQIESDLVNSIAGDRERFRQKLYSLGGEIDMPLSDRIKASVAIAYDRASTPLTGDRPRQPALSKWAGSAAIEWLASSTLTVTGTLGQRTRFPTMRELYGTALGRFLVNPDLRPETALVGDLTFDWAPAGAPLSIVVTPWFTRIEDTLSRRTISVDGVSLRQRYNLDGSFGYGIEATALWQATDELSFDINGFWQKLRADKDENGERATLFQRPNSQILVAANYEFQNGMNFRAELNHSGTAYDENEDGSIADLGTSTEINLKAYVPVWATSQGEWQIYGGIDNLTNTVVLPQLGLPAAGRSFKLGIRLTGN